MKEFDMIRTNHLIDPQLHIWGWEIPVYLFLGGVTAGIMIMAALAGMKNHPEKTSRWIRWMPFAAPIFLSIGMTALLLDLEHKLYVFRFYLAFKITAPISWGAWILMLIYPAALLLGLISLTKEDLAILRIEPLIKLVGRVQVEALKFDGWIRWVNIISGIALGTYTGIFLGSLGARAAWSSPILGPLFLVSGVSTALAFMMLFRVSHEEHSLFRNFDIAAIMTELALIVIYLIGLVSSGSAAKIDAAGLFLGGQYTATFWSLVVILGLVIPILLELFETRLKLKPTLAAPVLVLVGGFSLRWILVFAGQA